ncbi:MAG: transglycosylase SLT domain-containing protein [Methylomonas sp.]|jgi:soluble lytic murein transglycosylase-like protein|uniref:transglycosylase SLT domain-containing protein n=1 Tax=Methylomonas sp. TaxID=418 RepID=UPI0025CD4BC3|nr:transglycosylase SLT domain-containing protein [Methylomonas sp.]MCK9606013.1 transglycosylase SLT domain-containing protein [Methylomonas sp.]
MVSPNIRAVAAFLIVIFMQSVWANDIVDSPQAIRLLAMNYEHGRDGVKQDFQRAFHLYCRAALQGDTEAAYNLGFMYFNGRGRARDLALALRWFKQAAEAGDIEARNILARYTDVSSVDDENCKQLEPELNLIVDANPNKQKVQSWVNQIAPYYSIDPELVMAVIRAESGFKVNAISSKNAQGLMQLIPETAARFGVIDSWDPIQNITGGIAYLHWLIRRFDGRVDLVLAAYNAGEGAVERYKGIPPYRETQNYVKQILARYGKSVHPIPAQTLNPLLSQQKI